MKRCLCIAATAAVAAHAAAPPNILFIVADDLGFHDLGFTNGNEIRTPNIDALRASGVLLTNYYSQPVCSPSRATFMTGRYPIAYGLQTYVVEDGTDYGLNLNETTLPSVLKASGYQTAARGKWHLGMYNWESTPTFRGFDSFHGFYTGGEDYYTHQAGGYDMHVDVTPNCGPNCSRVAWEDDTVYSADIFTASAIQRIQQNNASNGPLYMYLAFQSVHAPTEVPQRYIDPYNASIPDKTRRVFAGMLSCLDEAVGNVTAAWRAAGLMDNGVIVFTTDNGGPISEPNCPICGDATGSSNYPLRGGKHSLWEGGVHATAFVTSPLIRVSGGADTRDGLMHVTDWFPTLLEAAGVTYTPPPAFPLHGVSQWQSLTTGAATPRTEVLLNIDPLQSVDGPFAPNGGGNAALRSGDWKLILGAAGPPWGWSAPNASMRHEPGAPPLWPITNQTAQLFNVTADPSERNDVAAAHPSVVAQLRARLDYWATGVMVPPLFCYGKCVDPDSAPAKHNGSWVPWVARAPADAAAA